MDRTNNSVTITRTNLDAEFCGKVPLHQTNQVQPHGILMIVKSDDLTLLQCSENAVELLGKTIEESIGTSLTEIIDAKEVEILQKRLSNGVEGKIPVTFTIKGKQYLALIQNGAQYFIAEIEREEYSDRASFVDVYQELKFVMSSIESSSSTLEACRTAAKEIKRVSGFDKVMIYRFDKDWNGEVIAEEMEEGMDSYMGLKFPASDVPKQARALYSRNAYRLIPNVDYTPIKLYPVINSLTHAFTDLTDSNLRSVVPVHIEYLRNMKVSASMSTRIMKDGLLWGLIACHHRKAKYLSYQMCSVFELLSNVITAKISSVSHRDIQQFRVKTQQSLTRIMESVYKNNDPVYGLASQGKQFLDLLRAEGAAICFNRHIELIGQTPGEEDVRNLIFWLQANNIYKTYQQPSLSSVYDTAEEYVDKASGLLAIPIQPEKGDYILLFRPEEIQNTAWGGNPNEAIQFEPDRKAYHPRNSFQQWQETVRKTAISWTEEEIGLAEEFRSLLIEYTLNKK